MVYRDPKANAPGGSLSSGNDSAAPPAQAAAPGGFDPSQTIY